MKLNQPVPELPVSDVEQAQQYYCKYFGCAVEWLYPTKEIGAVSNGNTALFFRKRAGAFQPAVNWVFCVNVDESYQQLKSSGANIVEDIEDKPWDMRQFTVHDLDGNVFYFHG